MRVCTLLSWVAIAAGCAGREESKPPTGAPTAQHGEHAGHSSDAKDSHAGHGGHENMPMETPRKLIVDTDPSKPQAGAATKLVLQIHDNGTPIKRFDLLHEKLVHLIVVRDGLDEFAHLHPDVDASGMITTEFTFPKAGKYTLFADHQPQGQSPGLAVGEMSVAGDFSDAEPLAPNLPGEVAVGDVIAKVTLKTGGEETTVRFVFVNAEGQPITDLQPYLGAMGHLVVIGADGRDYVHAHPLSESQSAPDGKVEFAAHFPKPGVYKAWGQFQRGGKVFTVPGVLKHEDSGHAHGQMRGMGPGMMAGRPGMGMMGGRSGMGNMPEIRRDMQGLMSLLEQRDSISREIKDLPNGVETITESDDPATAKAIREHVAAMYRRLEKNEPLPMMTRDPLFVEVFKHAAKIKLQLEDTPKGLKVIETSDDPFVAKLIQAHARVVDAFIANGMDEVHREHEVPSAIAPTENGK